MPSMMRFQVPPRADSLNHTPIRHVNNLLLKLIDGEINNPKIVSLQHHPLQRGKEIARIIACLSNQVAGLAKRSSCASE
jgi:hypothetical protein